MLIYVACIFLLSAVLQIYKFFQIKFEDNMCVFVSKPWQQVLLLCNVVGTFFLPSMITWASFIHTWYRIKSSPSLISRTQQAQAQEKRLLRMCAITATALTICWLTSNLFYVFHFFNVSSGRYGTSISLMLAMSNSIVNPWIYFFSNKEYRIAFFSIHWMCKKTVPSVS